MHLVAVAVEATQSLGRIRSNHRWTKKGKTGQASSAAAARQHDPLGDIQEHLKQQDEKLATLESTMAEMLSAMKALRQ